MNPQTKERIERLLREYVRSDITGKLTFFRGYLLALMQERVITLKEYNGYLTAALKDKQSCDDVPADSPLAKILGRAYIGVTRSTVESHRMDE